MFLLAMLNIGVLIITFICYVLVLKYGLKRNLFIGFRVSSTLASEEAWLEGHTFACKFFLILCPIVIVADILLEKAGFSLHPVLTMIIVLLQFVLWYILNEKHLKEKFPKNYKTG